MVDVSVVPLPERKGCHLFRDCRVGYAVKIEEAVSDAEVLPPASCDAVIPGREATVEYSGIHGTPEVDSVPASGNIDIFETGIFQFISQDGCSGGVCCNDQCPAPGGNRSNLSVVRISTRSRTQKSPFSWLPN